MMRVLIADDHSLFRDGLVSLLEAAGHEVVAEVGDGKQAVEKTIALEPDIALLDLSMPQIDGHEALKIIREERPDVKVVILTVSDEDVDLQRAIKAGAHGYLLKSLNAEEFLELLEGLQSGEAAITRQTATRLMAQMAENPTSTNVMVEDLTQREVELLSLVEKGFSNAAIAETLKISPNTVKYHLKNIFQKMGAQNRAEAVAIAIRWGVLQSNLPQN
jgi:DNA-binding NarL/FixJ family response regulator